MTDSLPDPNAVRVTDVELHVTRLDELCLESTRSIGLTNVTAEPALFEFLCDVIRTRLTALQTARVFDVRLGDMAAPLLRSLKSRAATLTVLNVCELQLRDNCAADLAALCTGDTRLNELWAAGNRFTLAGVELLCEALASKMCRLTTLSLGNNSLFDDACGERLAEALARNRTLTRLYLSGTQVTLECRQRMLWTQLWERNVTLLEVDPHVRWVDSPEGRLVSVFHEWLRRNGTLPKRAAAIGRLVDVAIALAELDLSVLEVIEIFNALDDGFEFVPPLFTKWTICALIKKRFRAQQQQ